MITAYIVLIFILLLAPILILGLFLYENMVVLKKQEDEDKKFWEHYRSTHHLYFKNREDQ